MLQRVQTIYLFLAFASSGLMLIFPIFDLSIMNSEGTLQASSEFGAYGLQGDSVNTIPLYLIFVLTSMLSLLAIFLYKNRKRQLLVSRLNLVFHFLIALGFLIVYFFGFSFMESQFESLKGLGGKVNINGGIGYYLLFVGIPFLLLAIRGIKADEDLLKSLDRLR